MKEPMNTYGLADLSDSLGNKINLSDFAKAKAEKGGRSEAPRVPKPTLPDEYKGKSWNELYQANELETIRTQHPEYYESLKKETFKNND